MALDLKKFPNQPNFTKKGLCKAVEKLFWGKIKGIGGGKSLFSQLDYILKSFIQATRCFFQISKT